jgi:hypothetical protein
MDIKLVAFVVIITATVNFKSIYTAAADKKRSLSFDGTELERPHTPLADPVAKPVDSATKKLRITIGDGATSDVAPSSQSLDGLKLEDLLLPSAASSKHSRPAVERRLELAAATAITTLKLPTDHSAEQQDISKSMIPADNALAITPPIYFPTDKHGRNWFFTPPPYKTILSCSPAIYDYRNKTCCFWFFPPPMEKEEDLVDWSTPPSETYQLNSARKKIWGNPFRTPDYKSTDKPPASAPDSTQPALTKHLRCGWWLIHDTTLYTVEELRKLSFPK